MQLAQLTKSISASKTSFSRIRPKEFSVDVMMTEDIRSLFSSQDSLLKTCWGLRSKRPPTGTSCGPLVDLSRAGDLFSKEAQVHVATPVAEALEYNE
jgi:hypothetical protein